MSQNLDLDPFWWEAAPRRELEEKPLPTETDVAIVGSGFAGSSAALVLARAGRKVTVLGPRFSVRRDGGTVTVAVAEGRVRVEDSDPAAPERAAIITAGDVAIARGRSMLLADRSEQRVQDALAWRRGMLTFDQVTLEQAAAEFNRYNRRQIRFGDAQAARLRIGGSFEATNLNAFTRLLHDAFGLTVTSDPDGVTIKS